MLGWQDNPRAPCWTPSPPCTAVCATGKVLVLDGTSDRFAAFDREDDWGSVAYAFGTIPNFGGRSPARRQRSHLGRALPSDRARSLAGVAWLPEASGQRPGRLRAVRRAGLARRPGRPRRLVGRATRPRRYGGADPHLTAAWRGFAKTVYALEPGTWSHAQDSLFCAWPDLSADFASAGPTGMRYDASAFQEAVGELLLADERFRSVDAYRYDVVDFTRQGAQQPRAGAVAPDQAGLRRPRPTRLPLPHLRLAPGHGAPRHVARHRTTASWSGPGWPGPGRPGRSRRRRGTTPGP